MTAYYNEFDKNAVAWLRELIKRGLIAPGDVDERSIKNVVGSDLKGYTQVHFFAGIGGWSYALRLAGWSDDVAVWTGSCPCQPFSTAGKRRGTDDDRHLWPEMRRLVAECRPAVVFGEQVASKDGRQWLAGVRTDLEALGYGVGAADLCAASVGAPHIRQRLWWVADSDHCSDVGGVSRAGVRVVSGCDRQNGIWLADAGAVERQRRSSVVESAVSCAEVGNEESVDAERGEPVGGMAQSEIDGTSGDARAGGLNSEWDCEAGRLANSEDAVRRRSGGSDDGGRRFAEVRGSSGAGFWSDCGRVACGDSKVRRIESGSFPLAHGVPARVVRLRGYGNAINPWVAKEFIQAYCESR